MSRKQDSRQGPSRARPSSTKPKPPIAPLYQDAILEEAREFMHLPLTERERQMRAAAFFKARPAN
jgi:hypothetical protein